MPRDDDEDLAARKALEALAGYLGSVVDQALKRAISESGFDPGAIGFVVAVFDFGEKGNCAYASTANREDSARFLRELSDKIRPI